jgi:hypothetical protein
MKLNQDSVDAALRIRGHSRKHGRIFMLRARAIAAILFLAATVSSQVFAQFETRANVHILSAVCG